MPPLGGMAPLPVRTVPTIAATPVAMRGCQATASPSLGAPANPLLWQATQPLSYTALPAATSAARALPADSRMPTNRPASIRIMVLAPWARTAQTAQTAPAS